MKKQAPSFKAYWLYSFDKESQIKNINNSILTTLRDIRADGFSSRADDRIDSDYIKTIRQAGFEYHCWTVDDPSIGKHFMKLGVQSITTNRPAFMRAALSR